MSRNLIALILGLAALLIPASASAVWGGVPDTDHPQVGAMYYDYQRTGVPFIDGLVCSGSYAGESGDGREVFLLAGHCLPPPAQGIPARDLYVSFSPNLDIGDDAHVPVGTPIQVDEYVPMPGLGQNSGDPHDLGVLLLPSGSVEGIEPVELAPVGYLDALKEEGELNFRRITLVGYGAQPDWESAGPTTFALDGKRRTGQSVVTGLGKAIVRFSQNRGIGTGSGGCFGDSGSPQIDENVTPPLVISVMTGGNDQCNSNDPNYRVDTPQARAFIGQFIDLP